MQAAAIIIKKSIQIYSLYTFSSYSYIISRSGFPISNAHQHNLKQICSFLSCVQSKAAQRREKCPQCYFVTRPLRIQTYSDGCDASPCTWSSCTGPALRFSFTDNQRRDAGRRRKLGVQRDLPGQKCCDSASQTVRGTEGASSARIIP